MRCGHTGGQTRSRTITMRLPYSEFAATYQVVTPFRSPAHPGSMWRGTLGRLLRAHGCSKQSVCQESCQSPQTCLYSKLFDPPIPSPPPHRFLRGLREAPPPLLPLIGWSGNERLAPGDSFRIGLRCLGVLSDQERLCIQQVLRNVPELPLGRDEGRVQLVSLSEEIRTERAASIRDGLSCRRESVSARLHLITPLWMEQDGRLLTQIEFVRFFTDLMRRLTILCSLYGVLDPEDEALFGELRALASAVQVHSARLVPLRWERHSRESDERHPLLGVLGSLTLTGPLLPFLPFLHMAEIAHLGKSTSFGLGRIQVEPLTTEQSVSAQ